MSNKPKQANSKGNALIQQKEFIAKYHHEGPLPSASELEKYDQVSPGAANRIITMAEKQLQHRIEMESKFMNSRAKESMRGQFFAFFIAIFAIFMGGYCILRGHDWAGGAIITTGLGGVISTFIYGTTSNRQEREKKSQQLQ